MLFCLRHRIHVRSTPRKGLRRVTSPRPAASQIRVALTGAAGGFGRTVLLALRAHPTQSPAVLCDLDVPALRAQLIELGYSEADIAECATPHAVSETVRRGGIAL